ncbi:MAG: sulfatase-like hydrolase/transferase [Opitutales bacterium]|nr:sulfatase-like hydrolase/transferase [Opitutales bacterium]
MKYLVRDIVLFCQLVAIYFLGRMILLLAFGADKMELITAKWLWLSVRFDLMTSAYFLLPAVVLSFIAIFCGERRWIEKAKVGYAVFVLSISLFFAALNVCFFYEYKSQFNQWILGIFYDDFRAIMMTIVKSYPIFQIALVLALCTFLIYLSVKFVYRRTASISTFDKWRTKIFALALSAPVCAFCMMGADIEGEPLTPTSAVISESSFLNNLIPNSAYCLRFELKTHFEFLSFEDSISFFGVKKSELKSIASELLGGGRELENIDEGLKRVAKGSPLKTKPSHIFLIIAESHSAWPLDPQHEPRNLMPETLKLCRTSLSSKRAISAGIGTSDSTTCILGGIPFAVLSPGCIPNYPTDFSLAELMKKFGYRPSFFCGAAMSWCDIGSFCKKMGFEDAIGGDEISPLYYDFEWGVPDKEFFKYIADRDLKEPTFSVILTVSNHPPYEVDLQKEGCPNAIDNPLERKVQHMWYADKCIGQFVRDIRAKYPDALIVITGDHNARLTPKYLEDKIEYKMCVPLIFAGRPIEEAGLANEYGFSSHIDIIPTLVELLADEGFEYKAWGAPLFRPQERKVEPLNPYSVVFEGALRDAKNIDCTPEARRRMNSFLALAYWRAARGAEFPTQEEIDDEEGR